MTNGGRRETTRTREMVINAACKIFGYAKSKDDRERIIALRLREKLLSLRINSLILSREIRRAPIIRQPSSLREYLARSSRNNGVTHAVGEDEINEADRRCFLERMI